MGPRIAARRIIGKGLLVVLAALVPLLSGCGESAAHQVASGLPDGRDPETGSVALRISLGTVALAKKSDTTITLDTLHLVLTSAGCPTRLVDLPVAGNINASSLALSATVSGLAPLRNWKIKAFSRDLSDSVLHSDSTTFYVEPADTAQVSLLMAPRYSVLVARFVSTNAKITNIEKLILRVNGVAVDDTTFAPKRAVFDVRLSHKYLKAGASATVDLEALDRASPARIRYSKTLTFVPRASGDSVITVQLN